MNPEITTVIDRIQRDLIGGAADISKEVTFALVQMVKDSSASNSQELLDEFRTAIIGILKVMSSFAPPVNAINRLAIVIENGASEDWSLQDITEEVIKSGENFMLWTENAISRIAQYGAGKISEGDTVFMYSMSSTVWRILRNAKENGKTFRVIVTESRPGNEGLWTVEKMEEYGIPVAMSIDACIGELIPKSDIVFVGADAISSSGIALCKVGTYPTALVAKRHSVPFYIAADTLKFDATTLIGLPFVSEPVEHFRSQVFSAEEQHPKWKIEGTMFDETPSDLISGIITEIGILPPQGCATIMQQAKISKMMNEILPKWVYGQL